MSKKSPPYKARISKVKNKWYFEVLDAKGLIFLTSKGYPGEGYVRKEAFRFVERINQSGVVPYESQEAIPEKVHRKRSGPKAGSGKK